MLATMRKTKRRLTKLALALSSLGLGASAGAQPMPQPPAGTTVQHRPDAASTAVDARWKESLDAFAEADRAQAPQAGGVLFVGSSSIRLWEGLEKQFEGMQVVKRGFGGSRMFDVAAHVDRLVLPHRPRLIVVYAGDNDLAEGRTPAQVREDFGRFVQRVREALPDTRIAFLSIKPSPLRAALMPQAREANALIAQYAAATPNLDYIDIYSPMLDASGQPRADLYGSDALHLNPQGYALWKTTIAPHLVRPAGTAPTSGPAPAVTIKIDAAAGKTLVNAPPGER